jgi:Flp pilus assembly protein protease CpaA/type IV secretory pathway VirB3-like protein
MIEIIIFLCLLGSVLAGLWDIKTTEVPDEIPALMVTIGIFYWFISAASTGNFYPLYISLLVGTLLLIFGLVMYKKGQWGGADAWVLSAIGYMIPLYAGNIFIIDYIFNFMIVSIIYMIIYALALGIKNTYVFPLFVKDVKKHWDMITGVPLLFAAFMIAMFYAGFNVVPLAWILLMIIFIMFFLRYARVIEKHLFKRKIPASQLKTGDVLDNMIWIGLTAEQVERIKKRHKYVTIKEGVRFVPVLPITLFVTLLLGNVFFLIL